MHKAGQICRVALNEIAQRKRLWGSTQSHPPPKDVINSFFLTVEQIGRIMWLLRSKHELISFGWVMGAFMPFPQTLPNVAASSIKSHLEKAKVMGQPRLNPPVDGAWAGEGGRKEKSLPRSQAPPYPLVSACPSASLSSLLLLSLLLLWVDLSVCLSA